MRILGLGLLVGLSVCSFACSHGTGHSWTPTASAQERRPVSTTSARVDFESQIQPMLKSKCQPCHFSGGKMYDKLPFDRPQTIKTLGTKLFTRIQDENERKLIREFLAQD